LYKFLYTITVLLTIDQQGHKHLVFIKYSKLNTTVSFRWFKL